MTLVDFYTMDVLGLYFKLSLSLDFKTIIKVMNFALKVAARFPGLWFVLKVCKRFWTFMNVYNRHSGQCIVLQRFRHTGIYISLFKGF